MRLAAVPGWLSGYGRIVAASLLGAIVVPAMVHCLHFLTVPLDNVLLAEVHHGALHLGSFQVANARPGRPVLGIVKIEADEFREEFGGVSPLDRCRIVDGLERMLQAAPALRTLAIDLDLKPTDRGDDRACQERLDLLLTTASRTRAVILITPLDGSLPPGGFGGELFALRACERLLPADWHCRMSRAGVLFGHPVLSAEQGFVRAIERCRHGMPAFSWQLFDRLNPGGRGPVRCERRTSKTDATDVIEKHPTPLIFGALDKYTGSRETVRFGEIGDARRFAGVEHVLIGAGYSDDDTHETPVGALHGADIHQIAASEWRDPPPGWLSFVIEMGIGLLLAGPLFHVVWKLHIDQQLRRRSHAGRLAVGVLTLVPVLLAGAALMMFMLVLATWAVSSCGLVMPVGGFVLGMAIDGAVVAGISVALHEARHAREHVAPLSSERDLNHAAIWPRRARRRK